MEINFFDMKLGLYFDIAVTWQGDFNQYRLGQADNRCLSSVMLTVQMVKLKSHLGD